MPFKHQQDLIGRFAQHAVAANLLMIIMLLAGVWGLSKLNTQFLPNFALDIISVRVVWSGASAEDVETSITSPIEQELRNLDNVKKMTSTSANGISNITLEYYEGSNMSEALDQVNEKVSLLRNLPSTAEKPEVSKVVRYEPIANVLLSGPADVNDLRHLSYKIEQDLLSAGIDKVTIQGLPEEEMAIQIPSSRLENLGLSLNQVADRVIAYSRDIPAGMVGRDDVARQLRSLEQRRDELSFRDIPVYADQQGRLLHLEDVAIIKRRAMQDQVLLSYNGKPAVQLTISRAEHNDALEAAEVLQKYLEATRPSLPPSISIAVYDESWTYIRDRIMLLVKNGVGGLILVILILYLFLNGKVAWWVTVGIPVSLMASQAVLYAFGGSINMITLFAMIMTLGIIVDDAIVVGEDALAHYQKGEHPLQSAEGGARRMLAPVMASSLTNVAAFLPLMMVGGIMGNILFSIPLVVICVIIASLIESFLILPGHLRHSFLHLHHAKPKGIRLKLDQGFEYFKEKIFRPFITHVLAWRAVTLACVVSLLVLGITLLVSGRMNFTFFPTPESPMLNANISFAAGTPPERVEAFLRDVEAQLQVTVKQLSPPDKPILRAAVIRRNFSSSADGRSSQTGSQFASIVVELIQPDEREVRNRQFIETWRGKIADVAGLEKFIISERRGGPPGRDVDIRLSGGTPDTIKAAALELTTALEGIKGVLAVEDDMPFGREQLIYRLRPEAVALGLNVASVGSQLRAAFDGYRAQIFLDGRDEVEVRVMLPDHERYSLSALEKLTIRLPNGDSLPLLDAVELEPRQGFEALRHFQGQLSVQVSADVDSSVNNANKITAELEEKVFPKLTQKYGVNYNYEGRAADQRETMADMKQGLVFGIILIYLVLAWVFGSYGWPLVVMAAIPFGLIGAIGGHWVMGLDLTLLSMFGFFGLSGIVINDSIVLVTFYRHIRESGVAVREALIEASCQRLRAVLLTSLTTIGGLLPLLFETSLQAQFLIPMAVSIAFGLAFGTVLVLLVVPTLLSIYEDLYYKLSGHEHQVKTALEDK